MTKEELKELFNHYIDWLELRDWTEWVQHTNTLYLQYNVDAWEFISDKYKLKWWDKVSPQMKEEILAYIWKKFEDYYQQNKDNMPWNI